MNSSDRIRIQMGVNMNNVGIMVDNFSCTGCSACALVCPYGNIIFKEGNLGFPVPYVEKCDNCGTCIRSCPFSVEYVDSDEQDDIS